MLESFTIEEKLKLAEEQLHLLKKEKEKFIEFEKKKVFNNYNS